MTDRIPPGVVGNNPFDLMYTPAITWLGQVRPQPKGVRLLSFDTPMDGIRAGMKDGHTKVYVHGYDTLEKLVPIFAPAFENNTAQYIANVRGWLRMKPNQKLDLSTVNNLIDYARAMNRQEVGFNPATGTYWYPLSIYEAAAHMALGLAA